MVSHLMQTWCNGDLQALRSDSSTLCHIVGDFHELIYIKNVTKVIQIDPVMIVIQDHQDLRHLQDTLDPYEQWEHIQPTLEAPLDKEEYQALLDDLWNTYRNAAWPHHRDCPGQLESTDSFNMCEQKDFDHNLPINILQNVLACRGRALHTSHLTAPHICRELQYRAVLYWSSDETMGADSAKAWGPSRRRRISSSTGWPLKHTQQCCMTSSRTLSSTRMQDPYTNPHTGRNGPPSGLFRRPRTEIPWL